MSGAPRCVGLEHGVALLTNLSGCPKDSPRRPKPGHWVHRARVDHAARAARRDADPKRVYYLSMEFLMGRSLTNALNNLGVVNQYTEALREMGYSIEARPALPRNLGCRIQPCPTHEVCCLQESQGCQVLDSPVECLMCQQESDLVQ